jgi:hypothetical protein
MCIIFKMFVSADNTCCTLVSQTEIKTNYMQVFQAPYSVMAEIKFRCNISTVQVKCKDYQFH